MTAAKEAPLPTPESLHFWEGCNAGELRLQHCGRCATYVFYPRDACPVCGQGDQLVWRRASGAATLHSYVISHVAAPGYDDEVPYVVAVVELAEGPRMLTNLVGVDADPDALRLDMPLTVEFEGRGELHVPVFRPSPGGQP